MKIEAFKIYRIKDGMWREVDTWVIRYQRLDPLETVYEMRCDICNQTATCRCYLDSTTNKPVYDIDDCGCGL